MARTEQLSLAVPWPEIRALFELGVPATKLCEQYHVSSRTLARRREAQGWLRPKEISQRAKELLEAELGDQDAANPLLDRRARKLIEDHAQLRAVAHQTAMEAMQAFQGTKRVPANFFEAEAVMRLADKAANLPQTVGQQSPSPSPGLPNPIKGCAINIAFLAPHQSHTPHTPHMAGHMVAEACEEAVEVVGEAEDGEN